MTVLQDLADERFVSLTTYRRNGEGVDTAVWVARDGDALVVWTPAGSGKVKRLRRDSRVRLRPCNRRGAVADGAPSAEGTAEVVRDPAAVSAGADRIRAKYGLEFRIITAIEKLLRRGGDGERVILRLT